MRNDEPPGAAPENQADQPITRRTCDVCGQDVDLTDPDQIFHHGPEPHEPFGR